MVLPGIVFWCIMSEICHIFHVSSLVCSSSISAIWYHSDLPYFWCIIVGMTSSISATRYIWYYHVINLWYMIFGRPVFWYSFGTWYVINPVSDISATRYVDTSSFDISCLNIWKGIFGYTISGIYTRLYHIIFGKPFLVYHLFLQAIFSVLSLECHFFWYIRSSVSTRWWHYHTWLHHLWHAICNFMYDQKSSSTGLELGLGSTGIVYRHD